MKMKKLAAMVLSVTMIGALLTGCGSGKDTGNKQTGEDGQTEAQEPAKGGETVNGEKSPGGEAVEITFFHYLEQYQEQFDKLIAMYKEVQPNVTLKVEIIGADYDKILQTRVATEEVPDIFLSGPYSMNEMYAPVSYNLTEESFVEDINVGDAFIASSGELTGIPFTSQAWGILYNEEIFEEVGITKLPQTLDELREVCEQIKAAGYIPFAQGYKSDYIKGQFMGFTYGADASCVENIQALTNKEKSLEEFEFINDIFDCAALVGEYTQPNPFDDDFAAAAARLGMGEAAMMISGDWIVENAQKANPDCRIRLMALPVSNDPAETKVYVADSVGLHVNKDTDNLDAVLEFVNWLVTSAEAKAWLSQDMKALSAIKGVSPEGSLVLSDALAYMEEGKAGIWASYLFPQGIETEFTPVFDKFFLGEITKEEAIGELAVIWQEYE